MTICFKLRSHVYWFRDLPTNAGYFFQVEISSILISRFADKRWRSKRFEKVVIRVTGQARPPPQNGTQWLNVCFFLETADGNIHFLVSLSCMILLSATLNPKLHKVGDTKSKSVSTRVLSRGTHWKHPELVLSRIHILSKSFVKGRRFLYELRNQYLCTARHESLRNTSDYFSWHRPI